MLRYGAKRITFEYYFKECYHSDYEKHNIIFRKIFDRFACKPENAFLKDDSSIPSRDKDSFVYVIYYFPPEVFGMTKEEAIQAEKNAIIKSRIYEKIRMQKRLEEGHYKPHAYDKYVLDIDRPIYDTLEPYYIVICKFYRGYYIASDTHYHHNRDTYDDFSKKLYKEIQEKEYEVDI
jgi:hypothetical protein